MAYNYLDEKQLADALAESEGFMQPFYDALSETERVCRGKPGKVPAGKPKVTDGTLAAIRREKPKQVIQQLPNGKVSIKDEPELEAIANGILTDIILPYANAGGDPFTKAKQGIKDTIDLGSSWAHVYFDRTGDVFHANYRRKYAKDVMFEKGKASEFDSNFMPMVDWYTKGDINAIIYWEKELKRMAEERGDKYQGYWDLKGLQKLLDSGAREKDDNNKSEDEKKDNSNDGYFKIVHFMQKGVGATFYSYAPAIKMVVKKCVNKDPRGIIPLHGLVPEPDSANPLGEPLSLISIGKQNLQDFNMQMYQYTQGMGIDPAIKKWGKTPDSRIKIIPAHIIQMNGTKETDDFETVSIDTQAIKNFPANYGLLKSQILNEMGHRTNDVSAESGNPGFSKTDSGVKDSAKVVGISNSDLAKLTEQWHGRIWETALNIQFAESQGQKVLDLEATTLKRHKLEQQPTVDYEPPRKIRYAVEAGTSQAEDNDSENQKLTALLDIKQKYAGTPDDKFMKVFNQIVKNAGVDDPEDLMYTEAEINDAIQIAEFQRKQTMAAIMAPQPTTQPTGDGTTPPPAEGVDPVAEDRAVAGELLQRRGLAPEDAEAVLQTVEAGA